MAATARNASGASGEGGEIPTGAHLLNTVHSVVVCSSANTMSDARASLSAV